jgi:hypothetical protein
MVKSLPKKADGAPLKLLHLFQFAVSWKMQKIAAIDRGLIMLKFAICNSLEGQKVRGL